MAVKCFCDNCNREIHNDNTRSGSTVERNDDGQTIVRTRMGKLYGVTIVYQVYAGNGVDFAEPHKLRDICIECVSDGLKQISKMPQLAEEQADDARQG